MDPKPIDSRLVAAYYEAASGVLMNHQYGSKEGMSIELDGDVSSTEMLKAAQQYLDGQTNPDHLQTTQDFAQLLGPIAVANKFLTPRGINPRALRASRESQRLSLVQREIYAFQGRILHLIQENWTWIERVAAALAAQGTVSAEQAEGLRNEVYAFNQRPLTRISEVSEKILSELETCEYAVLIGPNNCGKSYILKRLAEQWGTGASYLGPMRYDNFNVLGYYTPSSDRKVSRYRDFMNRWTNNGQNIDNSNINLQQAIAELTDDERSVLTEVVQLLLGSKIEIELTVPGNKMSQRYISCSGQNISYSSSGFRLITTLVTSLLDKDYETFLVDEPELGVSPEAQGVLADFLFDRGSRKRYFPHIKTLILATHSSIFLDRRDMRNNYSVSKDGNAISISRVGNQSDMNRIHFSLLGNRFETLYLPSAIFFVEGDCDHMFIERVLLTKLPQFQFSITHGGGDGRITHLVHVAKSILSGLDKSPYRDRIFVVLDARHGPGLVQKLTEMGLRRDRIIKWTGNGIEYCYPDSIVDDIFGVGSPLQINDDDVQRNGRAWDKKKLCEAVVARMTADTEMTAEFDEKLLKPLKAVLGI